MDPDQIRAGIGGLFLFSLIVAWAEWMNRLRPGKREENAKDAKQAKDAEISA
jgi:hypothetical protein